MQHSTDVWPKRPDINYDRELPELCPAVLVMHPLEEDIGIKFSFLYMSSQSSSLDETLSRAEEALINWSGQEVGVAKYYSWVWPRGMVKYIIYFLFRILCFLVYCK